MIGLFNKCAIKSKDQLSPVEAAFAKLAEEHGLIKDDKQLFKLIGRYRNCESVWPEVIKRIKAEPSVTKEGFFWRVFTHPESVREVAYFLSDIKEVTSMHFDYAWGVFEDLQIKHNGGEYGVPAIDELAKMLIKGLSRYEEFDPPKSLSNPMGFYHTEMVLRRSSDPVSDIAHLEELRKRSGFFSIDPIEVEGTYNRGHKFLPGSYVLERKSPSNIEEQFIYNLSFVSAIPTLNERKTCASKYAQLDPSGRELIDTFLVKAKTCEEVLKYLTEAFFLTELSDRGRKFLECIIELGENESIYLLEAVRHNRESEALETLIQSLIVEGVEATVGELFAQELIRHRALYPEKDITLVRKEFIEKSSPDASPALPAEVDYAIEEYNKILERGAEFVTLTNYSLNNRIREFALPKRLKARDSKIEFFALCREAIKRQFGVYPYNTQLLAVLLMIERGNLSLPDDEAVGKTKGACAQVKTGEGKSISIAMLALYKSLLGSPVHVCTSDINLARRDNEVFGRLYSLFGVTSGCRSRAEEFTEPQSILYTTNADLVFEYLSSRGFGKSFLTGANHSFGVMIVDEADNLCLDRISEYCRLSMPSPCNIHRESLQAMFDFAGELLAQGEGVEIGDKHTQDFKMLCPDVVEMDDIFLREFLRSAVSAHHVKEGEEYVISKGKIVLVDRVYTGRKLMNHEWSHGMHQLVALKHGLEPELFSAIASSYTHPSFLRKYKEIYGLSGTFGSVSDRMEIERLYGLPIFDVPTHHHMIRKDVPPEVYETREEKLNRILEIITENPKRPVLLSADTMIESEELHAWLKQNGIKAQLSTDHVTQDEEGNLISEAELIMRAGECGCITVTTLIGGRGIDIKVSSEAAKEGGLISIVSFLSSIRRAEGQVRGRAGRQGIAGTSYVVSSLEDDRFFNKIPTSGREMIEVVLKKHDPHSVEARVAIDFLRRQQELLDAHFRLIHFRAASKVDELVEGYFDALGSTTRRFLILNRLFDYGSGSQTAREMIAGYVEERWNFYLEKLSILVDREHRYEGAQEIQIDEACSTFIDVLKAQQVALDSFDCDITELPQSLQECMRGLCCEYFRRLTLTKRQSENDEEFDTLLSTALSEITSKMEEAVSYFQSFDSAMTVAWFEDRFKKFKSSYEERGYVFPNMWDMGIDEMEED